MGPGPGPHPSPQTPQQASLLRALGCKNRWVLKWRGLQGWSQVEGQDSALGRRWRRPSCVRWGKGQGWCFQRGRGAGIWGWAGGQAREGVFCSHQLPSTVMDILPGHRPGGSAENARFSKRKLCGQAHGRPEAELSELVSWGPAPPTWSRHMMKHARLPQTLWVAASPRSR